MRSPIYLELIKFRKQDANSLLSMIKLSKKIILLNVMN